MEWVVKKILLHTGRKRNRVLFARRIRKESEKYGKKFKNIAVHKQLVDFTSGFILFHQFYVLFFLLFSSFPESQYIFCVLAILCMPYGLRGAFSYINTHSISAYSSVLSFAFECVCVCVCRLVLLFFFLSSPFPSFSRSPKSKIVVAASYLILFCIVSYRKSTENIACKGEKVA